MGGTPSFLTGVQSVAGNRLQEAHEEDLKQKQAERDFYFQRLHDPAFSVQPGDTPDQVDTKRRQLDMAQQEYLKRSPKSAKNIFQVLGPLLQKVHGHADTGQGGGTAAGTAGTSPASGPSASGASSASSASPAIPAPPQGAMATPSFLPPGTASASPTAGASSASAATPPTPPTTEEDLLPGNVPPVAGAASSAAGPGAASAPAPKIPPPPVSQEVAPVATSTGSAIPKPPPVTDADLAATSRAGATQYGLATAKQTQQQQQATENANIGPKTQATTAADVARVQTIMQLPEEQRLPMMMSTGMISPALMHPVTKLVPNDPSNPAAGNHYESYIPLAQMMGGGGGQGPAAPLSSGWAPTQKSSTSQYNADTGTTATQTTTRKVAPGSVAGGRPATIPAPPGGGGGNKSLPETSAKPSGRIASMAQDYADEGKVPAAKDSPAVETYMRANNMVPGVKPTADEIKQADNIRKVEPMVGRLTNFLESNKLTDEGRGGMLSPSAMWERGKMQKAWEEYAHGLPPKDKQLGQLIKYAAALKVMGAAPWMTIGRSRYAYEQVVQHLPETTDTPAQLYDKVNFFHTVLEDSKGSLPQQLLKPRGPAIPPPGGASAGAPAGVIKWGRDTQGNPVQLSAGH